MPSEIKCEKCETAPATHVLHSGGFDPTDWHLCDDCDPAWAGQRNRSKLIDPEVDTSYDCAYFGEA